MKNSVCPKCGSLDIHIQNGAGGIRPIYLGIRNEMNAVVNTYACSECGYLEYYVANDGNALKMLAENWPRADGRKRKKSRAVS